MWAALAEVAARLVPVVSADCVCRWLNLAAPPHLARVDHWAPLEPADRTRWRLPSAALVEPAAHLVLVALARYVCGGRW